MKEFLLNFLNNIGVGSRTFEEEAQYREGVSNVLKVLNRSDMIKSLVKLEMFANKDKRSHERNTNENEKIVNDFLKKNDMEMV